MLQYNHATSYELGALAPKGSTMKCQVFREDSDISQHPFRLKLLKEHHVIIEMPLTYTAELSTDLTEPGTYHLELKTDHTVICIKHIVVS